MLRPRIIPCLLVRNKGLVKTVKFSSSKYVGDPLNAVRIFNEKQVDELTLMDIDATPLGNPPDYTMIKHIAAECRMPLCYGGGINSVEQAHKIVSLGVEKVAISCAAINNPKLIASIAKEIGCQSVVVVLDAKKRSQDGAYEAWTHNGTVNTNKLVVELAQVMEQNGVGEIVLNSIDHDGEMRGYDMTLAQEVRNVTSVPLTVLGGAGSLSDISKLVRQFGIIGAAAGSLFVFKGKYKAVLINYPSPSEKDKLIHSYQN
jgi:cyclase